MGRAEGWAGQRGLQCRGRQGKSCPGHPREQHKWVCCSMEGSALCMHQGERRWKRAAKRALMQGRMQQAARARCWWGFVGRQAGATNCAHAVAAVMETPVSACGQVENRSHLQRRREESAGRWLAPVGAVRSLQLAAAGCVLWRRGERAVLAVGAPPARAGVSRKELLALHSTGSCPPDVIIIACQPLPHRSLTSSRSGQSRSAIPPQTPRLQGREAAGRSS